MLNDVISAITTGISALVSPMVSAIKDGFEAFLYVDPSASTKVLSDVAQFCLLFLGISIGVGLVWLAISIFKRRKA